MSNKRYKSTNMAVIDSHFSSPGPRNLRGAPSCPVTKVP